MREGVGGRDEEVYGALAIGSEREAELLEGVGIEEEVLGSGEVPSWGIGWGRERECSGDVEGGGEARGRGLEGGEWGWRIGGRGGKLVDGKEWNFGESGVQIEGL